MAKEARVLLNPVYRNIKGPQKKADPTPTNEKPIDERGGFSANVNQPDNMTVRSVKPEQTCLYCKINIGDLEANRTENVCNFASPRDLAAHA